MGSSDSKNQTAVNKKQSETIPEYKVVVMGWCVGKTALIETYLFGTCNHRNLKPPNGVEYFEKTIDVSGGG